MIYTDRPCVTDLAASLHCVRLDDSEHRSLLFAQERPAGIAYVNLEAD